MYRSDPQRKQMVHSDWDNSRRICFQEQGRGRGAETWVRTRAAVPKPRESGKGRILKPGMRGSCRGALGGHDGRTRDRETRPAEVTSPVGVREEIP